jgi:hypothetical protein
MMLKMEAICSSERSVATQQTTRRHIPEDDTLHNHCCENLKSYIINTAFFITLSQPNHSLFIIKGLHFLIITLLFITLLCTELCRTEDWLL